MIKSIISGDKHVMANIVSALRYYSLFEYPLKAEEVYGNMPVACSFSSLLVALEDLEEVKQIFKYDGYYCLHPDVETWVVRRKKANKLAEKKKPLAVKVGKFIGKFPFVRFIGISGSLSKGYADDKSDFDYFIITDKNRLWICRTILHLFKKITFLAGQQHKFCMNYFVDGHHMEIEEQNLFTAVELSSLIPVSGYDTYIQLEKANCWVKRYLPNGFIGFNTDTDVVDDGKSPIKNICEFAGNMLYPEQINQALMRLTDKKWRKKWNKKNYPMEDYDLAFKTTLHVSKNHAANHQKRVLNAFSRFMD